MRTLDGQFVTRGARTCVGTSPSMMVTVVAVGRAMRKPDSAVSFHGEPTSAPPLPWAAATLVSCCSAKDSPASARASLGVGAAVSGSKSSRYLDSE